MGGKFKKIIKETTKEIWRTPLKASMRKRLKNHGFSLISSNCIGGILYHDVGEQFRTPTINLIIPQFVAFAENLRYYLQVEPVAGERTKEGYPVCHLDDLTVIGVHYDSSESLIRDWKRRAQRVNYENIFLIATDNFIHNQEEQERFDRIAYPKVCFTSCENTRYPWQVYLPEFQGQSHVGDTLRYCNAWGLRIFEKHFDCVEWLNEYESTDCKP